MSSPAIPRFVASRSAAPAQRRFLNVEVIEYYPWLYDVQESRLVQLVQDEEETNQGGVRHYLFPFEFLIFIFNCHCE